MQILQDNKLHAKSRKCQFFQIFNEFLGHVLTADGTKLSPLKLDAIRSWTVPTYLRSMQSFPEFVNYYPRFIDEVTIIATSLNMLQQKKAALVWTSACHKACETFKNALTCDPVVKFFDTDMETRIETECSGFALESVLKKGGWHSIEYLSRSKDALFKSY